MIREVRETQLVLPVVSEVQPSLWDSARAAHLACGFDYEMCFNHFFDHGWVYKGPDFFLMGGHDPFRDDAWLVWWAESRSTRGLLRTLLPLLPYHKPFISWSRLLKGRQMQSYYSTDRLIALSKAGQ